jgi:hypothetical protein
MAENNENPEGSPELTGDEAQAPTSVSEAVVPPVVETVAVAPPAPARPRLRDRVWSFRAMLAVAVATLLIGGAGGAAIVAATDHGHDRHRISRFAGGPGRGGPGGFGGYGNNGGGQQFRNGPGQNGQQYGQNSGPQNGFPNPPGGTQPSAPATPKSGSSS